jgi:hypothetical protein
VNILLESVLVSLGAAIGIGLSTWLAPEFNVWGAAGLGIFGLYVTKFIIMCGGLEVFCGLAEAIVSAID